MPQEGRFGNLLEGGEVQRFLGQFVLSDEQRARIPAEQRAAFPASIEQVLGDVRAIWQERGFLTPAETKAALIDKYLPGADPAVREFIRSTELARNAPDPTTGYLGKEHGYTATGLAHLYAQETGRPIAMIEVDFSNMGGTNKHFEGVLAKESGGAASAAQEHLARAMTDSAVRLVSQSMTSDLIRSLPEGARVIPIRTGGDEVRLLVTEADPQRLGAIENTLHAGIERHVAAMGLQDHPHLKDPDNPVRNGFGAAVAVQDLAKVENPSTLVQELDGRIKANKEQIGNMRLGQIDPRITPPEVREQMEEAHRRAAQALHDINPARNDRLPSGTEAYREYIRTAAASLEPGPVKPARAPAALTLTADSRPGSVAPMETLEARRMAQAEAHLSRQGVTLNEAQRHMLSLSVADVAPTDPSARTRMPGEVIKAAEIYAAETPEFQRRMNPEDPAVRAALERAGLSGIEQVKPQAMAVSFHNLAGLNEALGHHNADLALRHMSGMIDKSLAAAGIPPGAAEIAHHGGGNFSVVVKPGGVGTDGAPWLASERTMQAASANIAAGVQEMNRTNVADFLRANGADVDANMQRYLNEKGIATFADIHDSKTRTVTVENDRRSVERRVDGIHAVAVMAPVEADVKSGAQIGALRQRADASMDHLRERHVWAQAAARPAEVAAPADGAVSSKFAAVAARPEPRPAVAPAAPREAAPATHPVARPAAAEPPSASKFVSVPPGPEVPKTQTPVAKPEPPKASAQQGPQASATQTGGIASAKVQANAGRSAGVADVAVAAAAGDYGHAATGAAMVVGLDQGTYKAASTLTQSVKPIAEAIAQIGKRVPVVGAVVTFGFVAGEAGGHALDGNFSKAAGATVAGIGEIGGNLVGFGVGDGIRQGIVEATKATVGEEYAARDSGIVSLGKEAYNLVTKPADPPKRPPGRHRGS